MTGVQTCALPISGLPAGALAAQPPAVRSRLLKAAALAAGAPAGALSHQHVTQMEALVTGWHGQRGVDLPGGIRCQRRYDRLIFAVAGPRTRAPGAIGELSGRD